jgi:hypothetical protein
MSTTHQKPRGISAWAVRIRGRDNETIINARTAGQAKVQFIHNLDDCFPDLKFTDLRVRRDGPPQTSREFHRNAIYRGLPTVKCGDRVRVGESLGVIVGHNSSANFDVLFDDDDPRYHGLRLNVHPQNIVLL